MAISAVEGLAAAVKGRVVERGAADYDDARALYNAMTDKHPAAVAYCVDEADVAAAVGFARERSLPIAVRCGGHNGAGLASVNDGLIIDLSPMNAVTVDSSARMARVQGGAKFGEVDTATHEHGLAVPAGIISTTGVGGLTLGGGVGHLSRGCGLTIDNLLSATVVLADGSIVQTDADRESDLYWAIRGGGGNFGIVTSFSFRCNPVHTVQAGPVFYDIEDAAEVLRWYREFLPALVRRPRRHRQEREEPVQRPRLCRRGRRSRRSCTCGRWPRSSGAMRATTTRPPCARRGPGARR